MNLSNEPFLNKYSTFQQILLLIMLSLLCLIVFSSIGVFAAIGIFHVNIFTDPNILEKANNPNVLATMQLLQTLQAIGFFIVPAIGFAQLASHKKWNYLQLDSKPKLLPLLVVVAMLLSAIPFINYMAEWNGKLPFPQWVYDSEKEAEGMMKAFLNFNTTGLLIFNLFMMAVLPAIGEEFMFRGILQKLVFKITDNKHAAIWISAIAFSAFHMQFLGFFPRMILGAMFGYMVMETGCLWYGIAGHFVNNATAVIVTYLINTKMIAPETETLGATDFAVSMTSAILMILLMALFGKLVEKKSEVFS